MSGCYVLGFIEEWIEYTHKMAGQQQDYIDDKSTWFLMKLLDITQAKFIQNIMTSRYFNTSPWRFVKNTGNSLISEVEQIISANKSPFECS